MPWSAWAVHLLTASGALLGFLTITATAAGDYRRAFLWMAVATAIDSADGALARAFRVKERLPTFNGARLDDIVDYLTFVFAPAYLVYHARLAPDALALVVVTAMLLSSAYGFSQEAAKTSDHYFTGFPSYWNIIVFYLVVLGGAARAQCGRADRARRAGVRAGRIRLPLAHTDAPRARPSRWASRGPCWSW